MRQPRADATLKRADSEDGRITFWRGWSGLYLFILVYALLQIILLYFFTIIFNQP